MKILLFLLLSSIAAASTVEAQYLNRETYPHWKNEEYENYAAFSYRDMRLLRGPAGLRLDEEQREYDPFGVTLLNGTSIFRMQEYRTLAPFGGSIMAKDDLYRNLFQNLVVTRDSYRGWGSSMIVGRGVEIHFKPMLLSSPQMDGIRWDGDSRRNGFSLVGSRVSDPLRDFDFSGREDFVTYLFGFHWKTQIGSVLRFSASYANTHITDTLNERGRGSFRKGVFPINLEAPREVYLAVSDDSPEDGGGGRIHEVAMYVDGARSADVPQIRKVADVIATGKELGVVSQTMNPAHLPHARRRQSWLPGTVGFDALALIPGQNLYDDGLVADSDGVLEADNFDVIIYRFEIPPGAEDVSFRLLVSGDYAIDTGAPVGRKRSTTIWEDWRNAARARGKGDPDPQWVEVEYGFPTGLELYGAEANLRLFGFEIDGDYNVSSHHLAFPADRGRRAERGAEAYSVAGRRAFAPFSLGWEFFRVPPDYRTSFNYWDDFVNDNREFELVADNDDADPWPDSWEHEDPLHLRFRDSTNLPAMDLLENLYPATSRALGFGVYPGLDENDDGVPDTNVNGNIVPDHEEPFLMYFVESGGFVYGDDMNNNGVVDARENDNKPDYAYERDSEGRHLFIETEVVSGLRVTLGGHEIEQIAGRERNRSLYAKAGYVRRLGRNLRLDLRHRTKRVQDGIPDPTYFYELSAEAAATSKGPAQKESNYLLRLRPDPLDFRNSLANLSYARVDYTPIAGLNLGSTWRYELNHRFADAFDDGFSQGAGNDWSLAVVKRGDYRWRLAEKVYVTPMLKWSYRRVDSSVSGDTLVDETILAPIVRADFHPTERTTLRAGLQGFPFIQHRFRSGVTPERDFDAWHYIVSLQNKSDYTGYQVSMNLGFRKSFTDFTSEGTGRLESTEFFLQVRTN